MQKVITEVSGFEITLTNCAHSTYISNSKIKIKKFTLCITRMTNIMVTKNIVFVSPHLIGILLESLHVEEHPCCNRING